MSRHPSTPMDEGDLGRHLSRQTALGIGLVDLAAMKAGETAEALDRALGDGARIVSLDLVDDETLEEAGRLIWREACKRPLFAIGSQGLAQACVAHWRRAGLLGTAAEPDRPGPVEKVVAVSGSVSSTTADQIVRAEEEGFAVFALDAAAAVDKRAWRREIARATEEASAALERGASPIVCTARGPEDPAVAALRLALETSDEPGDAVHARIGRGLGEVLQALIRRHGLRRALICGGDSSSFATGGLGASALSAIAPMAPGAPLCRVEAADPAISGLELALKGGQMGGTDYFARIRDGTRD